MSIQEKGTPGPLSQSLIKDIERHLERVRAPRQDELYYTQALGYKSRFIKPYGDFEVWTNDDKRNVKQVIESDCGYKKPVLRGLAQIEKGNKLILAANADLSDIFEILFGVNRGMLINNKCYASIVTAEENSEGKQKKAQALVRFGNFQPRKENSYLISEKLAEKLGIIKYGKNTPSEIRIENVYFKPKKLNLDRL
jgi:hypothetical protein